MGKKIKKILITTGLISMMLAYTMVTGCSKKEAVTVESTQVEASFESQEDLNISTQQTSVSKELAEQASREIEELNRLESESQIAYDEVSGDIISIEQETENKNMMNVIRQDVVDGLLKGEAIDEEVDMWCDFLSEAQKDEFKRELHLLESPEPEITVNETQPKETKPAPQPTQSVQKPKETQPVVNEPAPQPTQPQVTEPAPQPTQPQNNSGEIDTSGWNTGGGTVEIVTPDDYSSLTPEQIESINNSQWN